MAMAVRVWEVAMVEAIITSPAWGDTTTMVSVCYVRIFPLNAANHFKQTSQNIYFLKLWFNKLYYALLLLYLFLLSAFLCYQVIRTAVITVAVAAPWA